MPPVTGVGAAAIRAAAAKYGVNPDVMLALAHHESNLDPNARGDGGHAIGLFQLNNAGGVLTGQSQATFNSYANPQKNADYAAQALSKLGIVRGSGSVESQIAQGVNRFERPANKPAEIEDATSWYRSTLKGQPGVVTTPTAGVPQTTSMTPMAQQIQPAATGVNGQRSDMLSYLMGQNAIAGSRVPTTQTQAGGTSTAVTAATAAAPTLSSIISSSSAATATGTPTTAGTLTHAGTGQTIPVQIDPGVNPDKKTAAAITLAKTFLGTPYKYGGASPKTGFDCSGLLQWVYAKQGINLPHYTGDMLKMGQKVNPNSTLKPGDAVFFNGGEHVGMYIGGGNFIQAPHTGDVVKISKLSGYDNGVYAVRRYA